MELPSKVTKFIELAGGHTSNYQNPLFFGDLITSSFRKRTREQDMQLVDYVRMNRELLIVHIKGSPIFDYFFGKTIQLSQTAKDYEFWLSVLFEMILLLRQMLIGDENRTVLGAADIFNDRSYIYRLQSTVFNHYELFRFLIAAGFDIGEEKFLVYSIISRGEVDKLKSLEPLINLKTTAVTRFQGVFATALKFGRHEVIDYLTVQLKLSPDSPAFGRVLDLEHYEDNPKYVFYRAFSAVLPNLETPIIGAKQNYREAFRKLLGFGGSITLSTLDLWTATASSKVYSWDNLSFKDVFEVLLPHLKEHIPISHDFGEFNSIVFGREWSDRLCLIERCLQLETQVFELENKNNFLLSRLAKDTQLEFDPEFDS